jgi:ubiquinone/menaquinone biosynthesis C-methylase UbiE
LRPIAFAKPRRGAPLLQSIWTQLIIAALAGLIIAALTHQSTKKFSFWSLTLGSGAAVFLIGSFLISRVLAPRERRDAIPGESEGLESSITSSLKSAYAVSSNWITLWRSPSFAYYLHLDTATALAAYSSALDSPLGRLSPDAADQRAFHKYGWSLVDKIANDEAPINSHRIRILIYPLWVYERYSATILQLIKSHSAGRIPCLPLVAEELYKQMDPTEKEILVELTGALHQNAIDKLPPRTPLVHAALSFAVLFGRTRRMLGPVFPDILLVDADLPGDTAKAWWYSRKGKVDSWGRENDGLERVHTFVKSVCAHAKASCWGEYTYKALGQVAVTLPLKKLESEAFFAREHYRKWIGWIEANSGHSQVDAAAEIQRWLDAEMVLLDEFVGELAGSSQEPLRILDLGCGYGRHLLSVARKYPVHAVGMDINERMIAEALDEMHDCGQVEGHVSFVVGDAALMAQLRPSSFDAAICMTNTLGNMPEEKQRAMLQRLSVVLRPGGKAFFSVYGEASTGAREKSYEGIGLRIETKENRVIAAEGLSSEYFNKRQLTHLIEDYGLHEAKELSVEPLGIGAIATVGDT